MVDEQEYKKVTKVLKTSDPAYQTSLKKDKKGEFIEVQHPEYGKGKAYIQEGLLGEKGHVSVSFSSETEKTGLAKEIIEQEIDFDGFRSSDIVEMEKNGENEIHAYKRNIKKGDWDRDKYGEAQKTWNGKRFSAAPFDPGTTYKIKVEENKDGTVSVTAYDVKGEPGSVSTHTVNLISSYIRKGVDPRNKKDRISEQMIE